jgi:hypothetical protein
VAIAPTHKIAYLIIFPNVRVGKMLMDTPQREKGQVTSDHPEMALFLNAKQFMGLLDTGNVSVIAE